MRAAYVPEAGDFVWLTFDPQAGREQAGRRPALVLTPRTYNAKSGLTLVCPITNQAKGYPFEVAVPAGSGTTGVILADHVKSVDWKAPHRETRALHNRSDRRGAGQAGAAARILKPEVDQWEGRDRTKCPEFLRQFGVTFRVADDPQV